MFNQWKLLMQSLETIYFSKQTKECLAWVERICRQWVSVTLKWPKPSGRVIWISLEWHHVMYSLSIFVYKTEKYSKVGDSREVEYHITHPSICASTEKFE